MANYHLNVAVLCRGQGHSVAGRASYISGQKLRDSYTGKTHYNNRQDILFCKVFLPVDSPERFHDLQSLCDEIEQAENRYDARTAREFKCSLPNELSVPELIRIVEEYVEANFVSHGLCAVAAIHEGKNKLNPEYNNPHVHIIVTTRAVGPDGFHEKKDREHDKKKYIELWREDWADVQNRAYERNGLKERVSHERLDVQGIDREPVPYLSRIDWQRDQNGERTKAGDERRKVRERNKERLLEKEMDLELTIEMEMPL